MLDLITEIIQKFGPRPAGSEAEKNAQLFIKAKCEEFTDNASFLPFTANINARFGKLKYYVVVYITVLFLYNYLPVLSLIFSFINAFFIIFDLVMFRDIAPGFPGSKQTSSNVEAVLEPLEAAQSTLIISAHMDSTLEYRWWYRLGGWGVRLTVLAGLLMVLQPLFLMWHVLLPQPFHFYIWLLFVVLTPVMIVLWSIHTEKAVPGAQDNLSGIAITFETFKNFADKNTRGKSVLKNTRLQFISFGSEERGLCGSHAYVQQKKEELRKQNAWLVNIDSIRQTQEVAIVKHELMNGTSYNKRLIDGLQKSFEKLRIPFKFVKLPIGGTDGVPFVRAGLPAVSVIGISVSEYDFTYHTRHDVVENIEPQALENVKNVLMEFIRKWDEEFSWQ